MNTLTFVPLGLLVAVGTYYATTLVQTVFHRWFGHHRRLDAIYENHVKGHHGDYPAARLMTDEWIAAERHVLWYYALPLLPPSAVAAWCFPVALFGIHVAALAFTIWWHLYLHKQYHLNATPWEKFGWFRKKRTLHLRHHLTHHRNYAIVEFFWDRLFGSYDSQPVQLSIQPGCQSPTCTNGCAHGRPCPRRAPSGTPRRVSSPGQPASPRSG
jgi:sterol desaturase/sphingolipid hydroxylase (fatty acid hydroxylase superfamily)